MVIVLLVTCMILVFWVTKLSANLNELRKVNQYNFEVYQRKFDEIEDSFKFELGERERLLERIHDLERASSK